MKENNEKKMKYCDEISKLIKAFPKDIAALRNENERCVTTNAFYYFINFHFLVSIFK